MRKAAQRGRGTRREQVARSSIRRSFLAGAVRDSREREREQARAARVARTDVRNDIRDCSRPGIVDRGGQSGVSGAADDNDGGHQR